MKFKPRFKKPRINTRAYRAALHKEMTRALAEATQNWIRAATEIIPVWSGASVATFLPLLEEIQGATLNLTISPASTAFDGVPDGRSASKGSFTADASSGTYTFSYHTDLAHLLYNEVNNANANPEEAGLFARLIHPGPYNFQERANERFRETKPNLPNPFEFLDAR